MEIPGQLYTVERDYHDHDLRVSDLGIFYAQDSSGRLVAEAESLSGLKKKLRAPARVSISALLIDERGVEKITVTTVSKTGIFYNDATGQRRKLYSGERLRKIAPEREEHLARLMLNAKRANAAVHNYIIEWPAFRKSELHNAEKEKESQ